MSATAAAGRGLDFAVLGNARDALHWIRLVLGALPEVRLADGREPTAADGRLAGMVLDGLEEPAPGTMSRHAKRVALVLEDPIRLLTGRQRVGHAGDQAAGSYVQALRRLTRPGGPPPLVIAADELRAPGTGVHGLLRHLGVSQTVDGDALASVWIDPPPSLGQGRRSILFAAVRDDIERLEQLSGRTFRDWRFSAPAVPASSPRRGGVGLFYAGRHREATAPPGLVGLDEWGVLPVKLGPLLEGAASLTVLDPLSFPFDSLRESDRGIPIAVELPGGWSAEQLIQLLEKPLLEHLGPFDAVAVDHDGVFAALRNRYSWRAGARVPAADLAGFAARIALDPRGPVVRCKADDRILRSAARAEITKALGAVAPGERPRGLVVASPVAQWASLLPLGAAGLIGVDLGAHRDQATAAADFPEWRFVDRIPEDIEVAHVAVSMLSLTGQGGDERRRRLQRLYRALRVGGRLVLVERFLDTAGRRGPDTPGPKQLLADVDHVAGGHLVLAEVQALRLGREDMFGVGLFAFLKVGRSERE